MVTSGKTNYRSKWYTARLCLERHTIFVFNKPKGYNNMIIKLTFDMFYTTIKTSDITEKELRKGLYNQFYRWLKKQHYIVKQGRTVGFSYDDEAVIKWLRETKFQDNKIEVLEKHKLIDDESAYDFDVELNF